MRDAGGARLRAPQRFLAPRQPQPIKVKLADQRDAPSPSQAEGAMPSGAILTKAGAIIPQPDCNSRRGIAPDCTKLHQIAVNCAKQSIGRKTDPMKSILLLSFYFHLIACKVAEASCLLALEAQRREAAATFRLEERRVGEVWR